MKKRVLICFVLAIGLLFSGCDSSSNVASSPKNDASDINGPVVSNPAVSGGEPADNTVVSVDPSELFSDRDISGKYSDKAVTDIQLRGNSAVSSSEMVDISGNTVTISEEGTYVLSGSLDDGMIIVNAEKEDKVQLVLDNAGICSAASAPIYVLQADKVFVTLAEGSTNTLSNGGTFTAIDENNIDAVIFSKEDLTLNGSGSLSITSPAGHGVVSKDELTLAGGSYEITAASHGLSGKDNICITHAALNISSGKDGIHAENDDDASLGLVYIESGTFEIDAEGDGISAAATLTIQDGSFCITSGGGSVNAQKQTSDSWGGFKGGGHRGDGPMGGGGPMGDGGSMGMDGGFPGTPTTAAASEEDSTSIKGMKSAGALTIYGGTFEIDAADDAIHSNSSLTVSGGSFELATGDDGFHADEKLSVTAGTIHVTQSYEGLEGLSVEISGGDIQLVSSDDGLNAAGGADQSGFGGFRGNDRFGAPGSGSSESYINISGGTLYISASGDGIDSNGTLEISGGMVTVCGPTSGDTAVLDYESSGVISGGTFIGTGAYMMAQTFSSAENQGVIAVRVGDQAAGTMVSLLDAGGNTVLSCQPGLPFAIVILSSPDMVKGETYTIQVGSQTAEFEAS